MQFDNEKEIENIIMSAFEINNINLSERGLKFFGDKEGKRGKGKLFQQINFAQYGIADLIYCYRVADAIIFLVIELKNRTIELKDFEQCARYITALKHCLTDKKKIQVYGILIGTGINQCPYLASECLNIIVYTTRLDINGLRFVKFSDYYNYDFDFNCKQISYSNVI